MNSDNLQDRLSRLPKSSLSPKGRERMFSVIRAEAQKIDWHQPAEHRPSSAFIFHPAPMFIPVIVVALVIGLGVGTAAAANNAKPGDTLYGVDRAVETLKLKLTFSDTAKAGIEADIAAERNKEAQELQESEKTELGREANENASSALSQALQSIARVRAKLAENENPGKAQEALEKVEEKLQELQERHQERLSELRDGLTEAEVKFVGGKAIIKMEFNDTKLNYQLDTTDIEIVIQSIAEKTGIAAETVRSILEIENENGDDDEDADDTKSNQNANTNASDDDEEEEDDDDVSTNSNVNTPLTNTNANGQGNGNANRGENTNANATWEIEVRVEESRAEIHAKGTGQEYEWTLVTTSEADILASIATKTGLSTSYIISVWDIEYKD